MGLGFSASFAPIDDRERHIIVRLPAADAQQLYEGFNAYKTAHQFPLFPYVHGPSALDGRRPGSVNNRNETPIVGGA